jgi:hypothetical protein
VTALDQIVALDISRPAIDRARALGSAGARVEFRVANIMDYTPQDEGPWDLIGFADTICLLGCRYPVFDVVYLATQLFEATRPGAPDGWRTA